MLIFKFVLPIIVIFIDFITIDIFFIKWHIIFVPIRIILIFMISIVKTFIILVIHTIDLSHKFLLLKILSCWLFWNVFIHDWAVSLVNAEPTCRILHNFWIGHWWSKCTSFWFEIFWLWFVYYLQRVSVLGFSPVRLYKIFRKLIFLEGPLLAWFLVICFIFLCI